MALVRILVDGYSLLHGWKALAPGKPRHSPAAREELIHVLTNYQDACGTPITVVFDGAGPERPTSEAAADDTVEILYSRTGQSADQMIERAAHRLRAYGEVLVVTDDHAERDTVSAFGAMVASCEQFAQDVRTALQDLERAVQLYTETERAKFRSA